MSGGPSKIVILTFISISSLNLDFRVNCAQARARALSRRKKRVFHTKLYDGQTEDGDADSMYFELDSVPITQDSVALRWRDRVALDSDMCLLPTLQVSWIRELDLNDPIQTRRENAPSKVTVRFSWDLPGDVNDMDVADACMTLEHYADWK